MSAAHRHASRFLQRALLFLLPLAVPRLAHAQESGSIVGRVIAPDGQPVAAALLRVESRTTTSDSAGRFRLADIPVGRHTLVVAAAPSLDAALSVVVVRGRETRVTVRMRTSDPTTLETLVVRERPFAGAVSSAPDVTGTLVLAGARSEVVQVAQMDANLAEKSGRQLFARVPGVFVYDMDGSGNQVNIATRGLDPHRSWELNVRQDGVLVNSDVYGYPASHYSPPMEAIERLELVRGTAALQYGSQFGGLLNYVTKSVDGTRAASFESVNSAGSFGLLSTYDAVGGRVGRLDYYAYLSARRSDGFRRSSESRSSAQFVRASFHATPSLTLRAQAGRSTYRYQIPGPLTDSMFRADPRADTRARNYYSPDIVVPSLAADWTPAPGTRVTGQVSGVLGVRNSVQFVGFATTPDRPDAATGQYGPRQVDIDDFKSSTAELRVVRDWQAWGRAHTLATGLAVASNDMRRRQQGRGTTGTDYDLALASGEFGRDIRYRTRNVAAYAEQLLRVSSRWSVIPGVRVERGTTRMRGRLAYYDAADIPREVSHDFPLFGLRSEFQARRGLEFYGGWSQAYRPQILKDVLPENALERTDPDLSDARGWTLEGGARGTVGDALGGVLRGVTFDIGAFAMRYDDRFGAVVRTDPASGENHVFKTNVGSTRTRGLEARVDLPLLVRDGIALRAFTSTAYFDARYLAGSIVDAGANRELRGNRVEGVPEWISRSGLTATGVRWSLTALASHTSDSFADPLNTVAPTANGARGLVPSYTLVDLNGSVQAASWLRLGAGVSNALDAQYFTKRPTFYPGPGIWPSDGRGFRLTAELHR